MAADVVRPRSAFPGFYHDTESQFMDTDVKVGGQVLSADFKEHLDRFYEKASPADRARCLELLTAIDISTAAKKYAPAATPIYVPHPPPAANGTCPDNRRPHSAMATMVTRPEPCRPADPYGPYTTTYHREYWGNLGHAAQADRPASTRAYQASYDLSGPVGLSNYNVEFCKKMARKTNNIRAGSSSGNRRNNPHPSEGFMHWRLPPRPQPEQPYSAWGMEVTDQIMDRVCRGQLSSTYQADYLGIQQGETVGQTVKPELDVPLPEDWRSKVPYSLNSHMRHSYQKPITQAALKGNNSRYGCNKQKSTPAYGVVPTVSSRQMNLKTRTTYERDYTENHKHPRVVDARSLGRHFTGQALAARAAGSPSEADPDLATMMASLRMPPTDRPMSRLGQTVSPDPSYMSTWVTPM